MSSNEREQIFRENESTIWNDQKIVVWTMEMSRWLIGMQELLDIRMRARYKGTVNNNNYLKNNSLLCGQPVQLVKYGAYV